jgi:VanZ family protein
VDLSADAAQRANEKDVTHDACPVSSKRSSLWPMRSATVIIFVVLSIYWVLMFYGTHTYLPPGMLPGNSDKLIHGGGYALLGILLMSLRATRGPFPWTSVVARWVVLAVYGAFDEVTQMFVNRTTDLHDWYADITGAALGLVVVTVLFWLFRRKTKTTKLEEPQTGATSY